MTTVLAAVRTVHESAAVCDSLAERGDVVRVVGVGVAPPCDPEAAQDAGEALNVLAVRLYGIDVETEEREGGVDVVREVAAEYGVDEVVLAGGFDGAEEVVADVGVPVEL